MPLIQIYQPADISGQVSDQVVTINPAHVRAVRLSIAAEQTPDVPGQSNRKRATACFVFDNTHCEYVHFPAFNYKEVLDMIREAFE